MTLKIMTGLLTLSLSTLTMAAQPNNDDGLQVTFEKLAPSDTQESALAAVITVKAGATVLLSSPTHLVPGCDHMPAVSHITLSNEPMVVTCGSYGGSHEMVQVYGNVYGQLATALLNVGEVSAQLVAEKDGYYILASQRGTANPAEDSSFQTYKLEKNESTLSFVSSDDQDAREIYRSLLTRYNSATINTPTLLSENLSLIEKSQFDAAGTCSAYKSLLTKVSTYKIDTLIDTTLSRKTTFCKEQK